MSNDQGLGSLRWMIFYVIIMWLLAAVLSKKDSQIATLKAQLAEQTPQVIGTLNLREPLGVLRQIRYKEDGKVIFLACGTDDGYTVNVNGAQWVSIQSRIPEPDKPASKLAYAINR